MGLLAGALLVLALLAAFVARMLFRIGEHLLEDEIKGYLPYQAVRNIERAVETLPPALQDAYRHEWMAELATMGSARFLALRFSYQCLRAARAEAAELQLQPEIAGHASSGNSSARRRVSFLPRSRARIRFVFLRAIATRLRYRRGNRGQQLLMQSLRTTIAQLNSGPQVGLLAEIRAVFDELRSFSRDFYDFAVRSRLHLFVLLAIGVGALAALAPSLLRLFGL